MADAGTAALHHALMLIEEFWHTSGPDHDAARREAQAAIARWRTYHDAPARAAYRAALARGQRPTAKAA